MVVLKALQWWSISVFRSCMMVEVSSFGVSLFLRITKITIKSKYWIGSKGLASLINNEHFANS